MGNLTYYYYYYLVRAGVRIPADFRENKQYLVCPLLVAESVKA